MRQKDWTELTEKERRKILLRELTGKVATRKMLDQLTTGELEIAAHELGRLIGMVEQTIWQKFYDDEEDKLYDIIGERQSKLGYLDVDSRSPVYETYMRGQRMLWEKYRDIPREDLKYYPDVKNDIERRPGLLNVPVHAVNTSIVGGVNHG